MSKKPDHNTVDNPADIDLNKPLGTVDEADEKNTEEKPVSMAEEQPTTEAVSVEGTAVEEEKAVTNEDIDEMLGQYERESRYRKANKYTAPIITVLCLAMTIFQFYMAGFGHMSHSKQRAIHLAFVLILVFLIFPARKKSDINKGTNVFDWLFGVAGMVSCLYIAITWDTLLLRGGAVNSYDYVFGVILVITIIEGARRAQGLALPIISIIGLAYGFLGPYLPGALQHRGVSIRRIIQTLYLSGEGIWGMPLGTSCTYVFLFIMFGVFLAETGLSKYLTDLALSVAGSKPGGPAKMAVLSSGFMGMISGSAVANVVTTGAFSIPLMKKMGYKPYFAGAVEAVASTGGQIMPPVMASAAFIMAEMLGVSYRSIIIAAFIPAVLYYLACWIAVDLEARKHNLLGLPKDQLPNGWEGTKQYWHLLIPVFFLVILIMSNFATYYAAFYSIVLLLIASSFRKHTRLNLKNLVIAVEKGVKQAISIGVATAIVGIFVGMVNLTGIGMQLSNMILYLSQNNLILTLVFTMIACFILGMGLPTSAAYIVAGTVAPVAMIKLGVPPMNAHLFVFYFACLSNITPPVALAAYAGAGLAGANPNKVGWTAVKLGLTGFIVPFMFIYSPALLMDGPILQVIWGFITASIGVFCLCVSVEGFWKVGAPVYVRIMLFAAALLLIDGGLVTDVIGFSLGIGSYFIQKNLSNKTIKTA